MNYQVLLIDDNKIALESMKVTIPWEELGLSLVGCAVNGQEGCRMISSFRPDIVISDIHMPEMDGLTMMEKMRHELANSRVIFITAYEKIEYASRAIRLAAFDFILKPLDNQKLLQSLERAIASLDQERNTQEQEKKTQTILRRARFLASISAGPLEKPEEAMGTFLPKLPKSYFFLVAESEQGIAEPLQRIDFAKFPEHVELVSTVTNRQIVMLCAMDEDAPAWQIVARNIAQILQDLFMNLTVAISPLCTSPAEYYDAFKEARHTLLRHDVYGRKVRVEFSDSQREDTQKHSRLVDVDQFCAKLAQRSDTMEPQELWEVFHTKSGGKIRVLRIMLMLYYTKIMQSKVDSYQWSEAAELIVYEIMKLNNEAEARDWLLRFLEEIRRSSQLPTRRSSLVRNVLDYVRSHVTDGLVLEDVAREFFVSPNYLSSIVHKETGVTYRQHVIGAKIDVAKKMLDDTRMRVEDIAYAVGYENYVSFYNVFKKVEQMSPSEYRFRNWKEEQGQSR